MIHILAIDDEPLALQQLVAYAKKIPFFKVEGECHCASEAWELMQQKKIDAIFCDINMPDISGLDLVRSLAHPPIVVFTTAYSDYALDGFKVKAAHYLVKPFSMDDFREAALRVQERYEQEQLKSLVLNGDKQEEEKNENDIFVKTDHKIVKIHIPDILYVEGMSEYLKVHLRGEERPVIILYSMKTLEEQLPPYFLRIHRSFMINVREITELTKNRVLLGKDISLPIGEAYREGLLNYVNQKLI
ncbi:MAG: LytTR family DNA-binding domain-containing protein [Prevotellaceae bacterium]|nr:LytTR family DNA-binding domain-containing protein [Prevotellaceae bacterium]